MLCNVYVYFCNVFLICIIISVYISSCEQTTVNDDDDDVCFCRIRAEELQQFLTVEQKVRLVDTVCPFLVIVWVKTFRHVPRA